MIFIIVITLIWLVGIFITWSIYACGGMADDAADRIMRNLRKMGL